MDDTPEGVSVAYPLPVKRIDTVFSFDAESGESVIAFWVHCRDTWPWGGREPLLIAVPRANVAEFLHGLIKATEHVLMTAPEEQ